MTDTTKQAEPAGYLFDDKTPWGINADEFMVKERFDSFNTDTRHHERINIRPLYSADTVREMQLAAIRETIKEALYQLGRSAKYGGCSDAEVMSWVDPQTILENLK